MRIALGIGLVLLTGCAIAPPQPNAARRFRFPDDTFAFANETVFNYRDGSRVADDRQDGDHYSRRCFVMAAAAPQFWKHARFEPGVPAVDDAELARRVREVTRRAAWDPIPPEEQRVVFPGFASLHEFSEKKGKVLRANLGPGWTTYFHVRKFCMEFLPSKPEEEKFNKQLSTWIERGHPMVLWLYNFPRVDINHAVVAYAVTGSGYLVYDPNFTDRPRVLNYDPATRTFSYEKTFYFKGGEVHVRPMYLSVWH